MPECLKCTLHGCRCIVLYANKRLFQVSTLCFQRHVAVRDWQSVALKQVVHAFQKDGFVTATMTAAITATRTPSSVVSYYLHQLVSYIIYTVLHQKWAYVFVSNSGYALKPISTSAKDVM